MEEASKAPRKKLFSAEFMRQLDHFSGYIVLI